MDWSSKKILITGGTGSFGRAFTRYALENLNPEVIRIFSRDELKQAEMREEFNSPKLRFFIGDVRDQERLERALRGVNLVIHAAAMKRIEVCEYNPFEAIQTNIVGTQNVISKAIDCGVERVLSISTDKAASPVNLYGATKLCQEKIVVQSNSYVGPKNTRLACVRYGNVVGSRGSVVQLFKGMNPQQDLPITDERMTRFWITLNQACKFVQTSIEMMRGGEIFIPKIPSMRVTDLAEAIRPGSKKKIIGIRPGEKLHEVMITEDESRSSIELEDRFVIRPQYPWWSDDHHKAGKNSSGGLPICVELKHGLVECGVSSEIDRSLMNSLFKKNIKALEKGKPKLYERLESAIKEFEMAPYATENENFQIVENAGKPSNLLYENKKLGVKGLYHSQDVEDEARQVWEKSNLDYPLIVFQFGMGLGYLTRHFFDHKPETNRYFVVVEKNVRLFLLALTQHDFRDLFKTEKVDFVISDSLEYCKHIIPLGISGVTTVNRFIRIMALPAALKLDSEFYNEVAKIIMHARDMTTITMGNSVQDSFHGIMNILKNSELAIRNPGLFSVKTKFEGDTIVSVAAGPSLAEHWETLKEINGKVPIVACEVLLKEMLSRGIEPDIVTCIERPNDMAQFLSDLPKVPKSIFVGPALLAPETFAAYPGGTLIYCPAALGANTIGFDFLGTLSPGSSCGNLNLTLAQLLGFKNIILVGHNLAMSHDGSRSHVVGTRLADNDVSYDEKKLLERSQGKKVLTQDGTMEVYTDFFWEIYRHQIEFLIGASPKCNWINTAPKGAKIAGCKLMTLKDALETYKGREFSLAEELSPFCKEVEEKEVERRRKRIVSQLESYVERIEYWGGRSKKLMTKIEKWKEEIERGEERDRRVSLSYLDEALDHLLKLKVQAVNKDAIFYNALISQVFPAHIAFERELNAMPGFYKDNYELKRDFLLKHEQYFKIWENWIPKLTETYQDALKTLEKAG